MFHERARPAHDLLLTKIGDGLVAVGIRERGYVKLTPELARQVAASLTELAGEHDA